MNTKTIARRLGDLSSEDKMETRGKDINDFLFNKNSDLKKAFPELTFKYSNDRISVQSVNDKDNCLTIQYNYDEVNNKMSSMEQFYYKDDRYAKAKPDFVGVINDVDVEKFEKEVLDKIPDLFKEVIDFERDSIRSRKRENSIMVEKSDAIKKEHINEKVM